MGHQRANAILRCFVTRDNAVLVRAFITYVRSLVEYNSVVWSPHLKRDIVAIRKVQKRPVGRPQRWHAKGACVCAPNKKERKKEKKKERKKERTLSSVRKRVQKAVCFILFIYSRDLINIDLKR